MNRARTAAVGALALMLAGGCKLIAGYQDVDLGAADAATEAGGGSGDGGCLAPPPTTLFQTTNTLNDLFVGGGALYAVYTNTSGGTAVISCDPAACSSPKVIVPPSPRVLSATARNGLFVTVSSAGIANVDGGFDPDDTGLIETVVGSTLRPVASSLAFPDLLASNATDIYYTDDPNNTAAQNGGAAPSPTLPAALRRLPLTDGGAPIQWMTGLGATYQVAVGSSRVFVLADTSSAAQAAGVFACGLDAPCGAAPKVVVPTGADGTYGSMAVDGDDLYYVSSLGKSTGVTRVSSGGASTAVTTDQTEPTNLAVDATHLYFVVTVSDPSGAQTGEVRRVKKDGTGQVERVVCGLNLPSDGTFLAVDNGFIYVAENDASGNKNLIERTPKP